MRMRHPDVGPAVSHSDIAQQSGHGDPPKFDRFAFANRDRFLPQSMPRATDW